MEQTPNSSHHLCHIAARQASQEQVSAALLSSPAVKLVRSHDSSAMLSLTRACLLLGKEVLSFPVPPTATAFLLLSNGILQGFEPSGATWSQSERYNKEGMEQ